MLIFLQKVGERGVGLSYKNDSSPIKISFVAAPPPNVAAVLLTILHFFGAKLFLRPSDPRFPSHLQIESFQKKRGRPATEEGKIKEIS